MLLWVGGIATVKCFNILFEFAKRKQLLAMHTIMNKVTGLLIFILPLTLRLVDLKYSVAVVCTVATVAAVHEGMKVIAER